jgi:hypothetical protein
MSGRFVALVGVIAAVFVASQIGLVRSRQTEASALRRRLGEVQARCAGSELALKKELQALRVRADWLQGALDRRGVESERLRADLAAARKALGLLQVSATGAQSQLDELQDSLEGMPGALRVELVPSGDLAQVVALATNVSGAPVEVLEVSGLLWLGGRADGSGYSAQGTELEAGAALELFEYSLFAGEPESVIDGRQSLRAALCFVWAPSQAEGEWLDTYWFEYGMDSGEIELVRRDGVPLDPSARGCDLDSATPPW